MSVKLSPHLDLISRLERGRLSVLRGSSRTTGIVSPWSDGQLEKFVWSDILGLEDTPVTRKEAMSVPAVAAARHRIIDLAARPLRALDGIADVTTSHPWLYRSDVDDTAWRRTAATLDDWIFYGWSLWLVARAGATGEETFGLVQDAQHVPFHRWAQGDDGTVTVDDQPVPEGSFVILEGPFEGLLNIASESIRAAKALERAWASRVRNPTPTIILEEREDGTVTKREAKAYVKAVAAATSDPDGAIFFAPAKINARIGENSGVDVLTEARNAVRIDIANYLNLNASALDAAKPQSSLTYETQETERVELADRMTFWTAPLEQRLSQDDMVPKGIRVRFDFAQTTPAQTGAPMED